MAFRTLAWSASLRPWITAAHGSMSSWSLAVIGWPHERAGLEPKQGVVRAQEMPRLPRSGSLLRERRMARGRRHLPRMVRWRLRNVTCGDAAEAAARLLANP